MSQWKLLIHNIVCSNPLIYPVHLTACLLFWHCMKLYTVYFNMPKIPNINGKFTCDFNIIESLFHLHVCVRIMEHFMQIWISSPSAFQPIPMFKNTFQDSQFPLTKKWKCTGNYFNWLVKGIWQNLPSTWDQSRDIILTEGSEREVPHSHTC